jgi:double-stranded uracil-DNA glycosylase
MRAEGFEPIETPEARVLILGTLPSAVSLQKRQYYARPQNVFWRIMESLFSIPVEMPYPERTQRLTEHGIALWDVCRAAYRPGSLDSSIQDPEPNDFRAFLAAHRHLRLICFNGTKAAALYEKHVDATPRERRIIRSVVLPSTSPANAAMRYETKLSRWSIVRGDNGILGRAATRGHRRQGMT